MTTQEINNLLDLLNSDDPENKWLAHQIMYKLEDKDLLKVYNIRFKKSQTVARYFTWKKIFIVEHYEHQLHKDLNDE